jgi:uncharacterized protein YhhL (DUF1145 family)
MQRFALWFGRSLGVVLVLHGLALALLQSPLIATSNKRGALLYFRAVEAIFGESVAWILSGLLWLALGLMFLYPFPGHARKVASPHAKASEPPRRGIKVRRKRR